MAKPMISLGYVFELRDVPDEMALRVPTRAVLKDAVHGALAVMHKHGYPTDDPVRAAVILAEECGEFAQAVLTWTSTDARELKGETREDWYRRARRELLDIAQYALLQIQNFDDGGPTKWVQERLKTKS